MVTSSPIRRRGWRLIARDTATPSQAADLVGGEAVSRCSLSSLPIEDAGDHLIGVKRGQTPQKRKRVFIRARPHRLELWNGNIQSGEGAAAPAQRQVSAALGPLEIENHFFQ